MARRKEENQESEVSWMQTEADGFEREHQILVKCPERGGFRWHGDQG